MKIPESFAWLRRHGSEALWLGPESTPFIVLMTWQKIKWLELQLGLGSSRLLTWLGAWLASTKHGTWIETWSSWLDSDVCLNLLSAQDMEITAPRFQLWWIQHSFDFVSWKLETSTRLLKCRCVAPSYCVKSSMSPIIFRWRCVHWSLPSPFSPTLETSKLVPRDFFSPENLIALSVKSFRVLCFCLDVVLAGNAAQTCLWKWSTSTPTCCHIWISRMERSRRGLLAHHSKLMFSSQCHDVFRFEVAFMSPN